VTDAEIECASPVTYAPRGTSTMVSCRYTLAGVAHVRARPGVHLAAQHIQVGFRPDLGMRWLLCSRAPSGAHLAELATLLLAGGDAVGSDIILTRPPRSGWRSWRCRVGASHELPVEELLKRSAR